MTKQTKRLPMDTKYFEANGKKYHVSKTLSIERWRYFEDYQALVGFGRSFQDIFTELVKAWNAHEESKFATVAIIIHNIIKGIKEKLEERHDPALMLCALFVNYEGEDERIYDEELIKSKIEDWQKEGYAMQDFFTLAFNLVPDFLTSYDDVLKNTLNPTKEKKSSPSKEKK